MKETGKALFGFLVGYFVLGPALSRRRPPGGAPPAPPKVNQTELDKPESPGPERGYKLGRPVTPDETKFQAGDFVKLRFLQGPNSERMWVKVTSLAPLQGTLDTVPVLLKGIPAGSAVIFQADKVYEVTSVGVR
jgi:hypothetical protein